MKRRLLRRIGNESGARVALSEIIPGAKTKAMQECNIWPKNGTSVWFGRVHAAEG
jgi:hypothetical protein